MYSTNPAPSSSSAASLLSLLNPTTQRPAELKAASLQQLFGNSAALHSNSFLSALAFMDALQRQASAPHLFSFPSSLLSAPSTPASPPANSSAPLPVTSTPSPQIATSPLSPQPKPQLLPQPELKRASPSLPAPHPYKKRVLSSSQEIHFKREFAVEIQCKQSLHRPKMREFVKNYSTPENTFTWQQLERLLKRKREQTRRKRMKLEAANPSNRASSRHSSSQSPPVSSVSPEATTISLPTILTQQQLPTPSRHEALPSLPSCSSLFQPNYSSFQPCSSYAGPGAFQSGNDNKQALEQLRALATLATSKLCTADTKCSAISSPEFPFPLVSEPQVRSNAASIYA